VRGRYEIVSLLGRGGMGAVYEAEVLGTKRRVAIKVMHGFLGRVREAEARFRREARALHKLHSPHVARLHDFGRLEQGSLFLVMEHVAGRDLVREVEARGALPWAEAYRIIDQVCAAMEVVHAAGVVHRDLKPRNVIVGSDGSVKVVDFGLAKSLHASRDGKRITREGQAIGSLCYMAPEQAVGRRNVDMRADVFSIGCMLYFLLMGQPPFAQRAIARAGREGCALSFPSIGFHRGDVPAHVDEVLRVALSPDAAHRFRSVSALRTALANDGRDVPTLIVDMGVEPALPRIWPWMLLGAGLSASAAAAFWLLR
jgi:serine/threonine protein kinase